MIEYRKSAPKTGENRKSRERERKRETSFRRTIVIYTRYAVSVQLSRLLELEEIKSKVSGNLVSKEIRAVVSRRGSNEN